MELSDGVVGLRPQGGTEGRMELGWAIVSDSSVVFIIGNIIY